jgi:drug/metabolite transporter (DMT)-like permease
MLAGTMAFGALMTLPFYLWETVAVRAMPMNATAFWTVGYVAVFASIVAYICYNRGIELVGPSRAALTAHMLPVFAAILSVVFLGETLHLYHLAGAAAVVMGIVLTGGSSGNGSASTT